LSRSKPPVASGPGKPIAATPPYPPVPRRPLINFPK
jgi:hypothetical protein